MRGRYPLFAHRRSATPLRPFALAIALAGASSPGCEAFTLTAPRMFRSASDRSTMLSRARVVPKESSLPAKTVPSTSLAFKQSGRSDDERLASVKKEEERRGAGAEEGRGGVSSYLSIVLPLLLVYISNQWSRSSLYYLVNFSESADATAFTAMNVDLSFTQAQYGALASVAFTALFAVAS